jgi:hypothetical protein
MLDILPLHPTIVRIFSKREEIVKAAPWLEQSAPPGETG